MTSVTTVTGDRAGVLLAAARTALDGELSLPPGRATRAAALLARSALEASVAGHLARRGFAVPGASMRVQLVCLRVCAGPVDGADAAWAWATLSGACHHHAYELTPTATEVAHLLDVVADLRVRLGATAG